MFGASAKYYDLLYGEKDYPTEAARLLSILGPDSTSLLDVACGTGEHHRFLSGSISELQGVDSNGVLLDKASIKNPSVDYYLADMRCFSTGRSYAAVTCLFGAIGYCQDTEQLAAAMSCLARHLAPGGTLLVEPWLEPQSWETGRTVTVVRSTDEVELRRHTHSRREANLSITDCRYAVSRRGALVESFFEQHRLGLFSRGEMTSALETNGLRVRYDPVGICGRGLYIAERCR